ncbi:MAG: 4-hydroxythreonine-4-phosphate dehydrogenase PdxA [Ottowia sp.]|uniref:4-hydroxythreonine-4-phosphate dehydrogenase PdxA n=1 Tax=Ottowia sp. TaxID=1898956 RepID=UPI003C774816
MTLPIAITMGDPAGIGPEIIAKAFRDAPDLTAGCFVAGDVATLRRAAGLVQEGEGASLPVAVLDTANDAWRAPPRSIPVLQIVESTPLVPFGLVNAAAGKIAGDSVFWAARAALRGEVAAVVTAPLHKEALSAAGDPYARFPGHTELLQAEAAAQLGRPLQEVPVRMMLANDELRTVLVSIHLSLLDAIGKVTVGNILQTLRITHESVGAALQRPPRIGVAGLNPHAGEGGLFGREEIEVIAPAIAAARAEGIDAQGPFAPDTVFMRARATPGRLGEFDVVVAMYHDQGLIPVKYLGVEQGVNVTLGLPFVRTSPDHGTAFDIAGSGRADAASLLAAIRMARRLLP